MVLESSVQSAIMKWLKTIPNSDWVKPTVTNKAGWPDISGHVQGQAVFIEVKRDAKSKPSKIQQHIISQIVKHGGISFVAYTVSSVREKLREELLKRDIVI